MFRLPPSPAPRAAILLVASVAIGAVRLEAQVLTLADALARADSGAYANRAARGGADAQRGQAAMTWQGLLPSVRVEGGYLRTTDPLGAFGYVLRQRAVTPAAFDPASLNSPAAIGNYSGALVLEQPLVNVDAWLARSSASRAADAARASAGWTVEETRLQVFQAYYGASLAARQVGTLEAALSAAREHVRRTTLMADNGLVTRSDVLLAEVRAGQVEAGLLAARGGARLARQRLALLMGTPADTAFALPESLPPPGVTTAWSQVREVPGADGPAGRLDVQAARLAERAAAGDLRRSRARMLPRLNAFGRYDWNSSDGPYRGDESWTIGLMVTWAPFSGGAELAEARAARGRLEAARAMAEAAAGRAEVELRERRSDLEVARASLGIAERAVAQAAEAHRIVARKYEGGLAGVVELLDAAAIDTEARLRLDQATWQLIVATAAYRQARGEPLTAPGALED